MNFLNLQMIVMKSYALFFLRKFKKKKKTKKKKKQIENIICNSFEWPFIRLWFKIQKLNLTFKALITTAADNILICFVFLEKK